MRNFYALTLLLIAVSASTILGASVDNRQYGKKFCQGKPNGLRALVPGSCSKFIECYRGESKEYTCPNTTTTTCTTTTSTTTTTCTTTTTKTTTTCTTTTTKTTTTKTTTCTTTTTKTTTCTTTTCPTPTTLTTPCITTTTACAPIITTPCPGSKANKGIAALSAKHPIRARPNRRPLKEVAQALLGLSSIENGIQINCIGKPDGFLMASPKRCNDYYICRHQQALKVSCGDRYFNGQKGICDLPENTGCVQH
ncbi:hypothetical protein AWZ03_005951 [Drosophila navojoa]|uniref:Chitin-binding type-2 domain-containing protein n=1 Tax=Drosophila navojoa TaxID=7232 RepID=A0A484BFW3_DRONA|nr:hypothetical protein AWZ03_005951 [Drosophila navojoa]